MSTVGHGDLSGRGRREIHDTAVRMEQRLPRMLRNEKETAFRAGCHQIAKNSTFYDLDELERCFGRTDSAP